MIEGKLAQDHFALAREPDADLPPVAFRAVAPDQPALRQAVDQPHRAVMLELQPLSQFAPRRRAGVSFDAHQQFVRGGFQSGPPRRMLAKTEKSADLITKFGQSP